MLGWRLDGVRMELFVGGISPPFFVSENGEKWEWNYKCYYR